MWHDNKDLYESAANLLWLELKLEAFPDLAEKYLFNEKGEEIPEMITAYFLIRGYRNIAQNDALERSSGKRKWYDIG